MSRTKDEVTLWVRRGTPKTPETAICGLWMQYHIKAIVAKYRSMLDDTRSAEQTYIYPQVRIEKIVLKEGGISDAAGPTQYRISGSCKELGSEKLWKALMCDVATMLDMAEPFMDGSGMSTKYSTKVRPEWFTWNINRGILANCSKPMTIHSVGKSCRLANRETSCLSMPVTGMESVYFDTRVVNLYAVGEACSAGKLVSAARKQFKETHSYSTNERIFDALVNKMDRNSVLVAQCEPVLEGDPEWIVIHPKPWHLSIDDIGPQLGIYTERVGKWLDTVDPFQHELSERNGLEAIELVRLAKDYWPSVGTFTEQQVAEALHNGN